MTFVDHVSTPLQQKQMAFMNAFLHWSYGPGDGRQNRAAFVRAAAVLAREMMPKSRIHEYSDGHREIDPGWLTDDPSA